MGAHKSKDPRFRASIERGSKIFRRAVLDTDREYIRSRRSNAQRSREETNKQTPVNNKQSELTSYSSLDGIHQRGLPEVKTEEAQNPKSEQLAKASLWDGDVSFIDDGGTGFRPRSSTYDGPHERHKQLSVHFASNLVSTRPSSHKSTGDIHLKGILRHDSAYERNKKLYENHIKKTMMNGLDDPSKNPHQKLSRKHRQRSASLENIRTRTQKTAHTDFINQQSAMDSPTISRKSRKDNHLNPANHLAPPRVKGTGSSTSRHYYSGDISPSRSPNRASPAKSVRSMAPHHSREHNYIHHGYANSPFSQRRLMLMSL